MIAIIELIVYLLVFIGFYINVFYEFKIIIDSSGKNVKINLFNFIKSVISWCFTIGIVAIAFQITLNEIIKEINSMLSYKGAHPYVHIMIKIFFSLSYFSYGGVIIFWICFFLYDSFRNSLSVIKFLFRLVGYFIIMLGLISSCLASCIFVISIALLIQIVVMSLTDNIIIRYMMGFSLLGGVLYICGIIILYCIYLYKHKIIKKIISE